MKILVVSDSHGNDEILMNLYSQYPSMDYYLHAGDSQSSSMVIYPFDSVLGNCDYYDYDRCRKIHTPMGYLFMKHHPDISSKEKEGVKFFIYGHTHRHALYEESGLIVINPGSVTFPRDGTIGSYAVLDIEENHAEITIYELDTKIILKRMKL